MRRKTDTSTVQVQAPALLARLLYASLIILTLTREASGNAQTYEDLDFGSGLASRMTQKWKADGKPGESAQEMQASFQASVMQDVGKILAGLKWNPSAANASDIVSSAKVGALAPPIQQAASLAHSHAQKKGAQKGAHLQNVEFTCQAFPAYYNPLATCSGVVDYAFIVYDGLTVADLETQARTAMASLTHFLNSACLSDIKRLLCASVYQPCLLGAVAGDYATYQPAGYFPLPFLRPCRSLCDAVGNYYGSCGAAAYAFGLVPDCTAMSPYTYAELYDSTSTPVSQATLLDGAYTTPVCNDLASTVGMQVVASASEPYVGEICKGITTELWMSPSAFLGPALAPMLPPFVYQAAVESTIVYIDSLIPAFFPEKCRVAGRKLTCSSYFLKPEEDLSLAMYLGPLQIPAFPARQVCLDYKKYCPELDSLAPTDCEATIAMPGNPNLYPKTDQVVFSFDLGFGPINMVSSPNTLADASISLPTECPHGLAVPDHPEYTNSVAVKDTGCSISCPSKDLTQKELDGMYYARYIVYWTVLIISILQAVNLSILDAKRQNMFVVMSVYSLIIFYINQVFQLEYFKNDYEEISCSSNTSWHDVADFGDDFAGTYCAVTAAINLYIGAAVPFFICISLSIEIWLRVVKGVKEKDINKWRKWFLPITGLLCLGWALFNNLFGEVNITTAAQQNFTCYFNPVSYKNRFYYYTIPEIIAFTFSISLFAHVVYVCFKTSLKVKDGTSPFKRIWKSYSMIFLFLLLQFAMFVLNIFYTHLKVVYLDVPGVKAGSRVWYSCMFANFSRASDTTYLEVCGNLPQDRVPLGTHVIEFPVAIVSALVLFYITLYREVRLFWHALFLRVTGLRMAAEWLLPKKYANYFKVMRSRASSVYSSEKEEEEESSVQKDGLKPAPTPAVQSIGGWLLSLLGRGHTGATGTTPGSDHTAPMPHSTDTPPTPDSTVRLDQKPEKEGMELKNIDIEQQPMPPMPDSPYTPAGELASEENSIALPLGTPANTMEHLEVC